MERMDDPEFIARVTSHIPDKGQVTVRYYGRYTNAHRGKVRQANFEAFPLRVDEEERRPIPAKGWAALVRRPHGGRRNAGMIRKVSWGVPVEPVNVTQARLARKRRRRPRYAVRKTKGYRVEAPGDLVEVVTLLIGLVPNEIRYQLDEFTALTPLPGRRYNPSR